MGQYCSLLPHGGGKKNKRSSFQYTHIQSRFSYYSRFYYRGFYYSPNFTFLFACIFIILLFTTPTWQNFRHKVALFVYLNGLQNKQSYLQYILTTTNITPTFKRQLDFILFLSGRHLTPGQLCDERNRFLLNVDFLPKHFDVWVKCECSIRIFIFSTIFYLYPNFRLLTTISSFNQNGDFLPNFRFLTKLSIFDPNFDFWFWQKICFFGQNFNFLQKFQFLFFDRIFDFDQNFDYLISKAVRFFCD